VKWAKYSLIVAKSILLGTTVVNFGRSSYFVAGNVVKKLGDRR
jgi:hypothetical protein